jgi:hypothetical protein
MADVEELLPVIEYISRNIASDYPDIDWQDVKGHLCVFVIEKGDQLVWQGRGGSVRKILKRVANSYCKQERTRNHYLSPQYSYRPSEVMKMLESAWTYEEIPYTHVPDDAVSLKSDVDSLDLASDIREAFDMLRADLQEAIFVRYALGVKPEHASYERKRLNRAVKELTRILNSYRGKDIPRRRRVISNSTAQAIISKSW